MSPSCPLDLVGSAIERFVMVLLYVNHIYIYFIMIYVYIYIYNIYNYILYSYMCAKIRSVNSSRFIIANVHPAMTLVCLWNNTWVCEQNEDSPADLGEIFIELMGFQWFFRSFQPSRSGQSYDADTLTCMHYNISLT